PVQSAAELHPQRNWVQIATGPQQSGLRFTYRQMARGNAGFAGREGWSAPFGRTNRLLVGPFDTLREAQQLASAMREAGGDAFAWRSSAGEEVTRLFAEGESPQPSTEARAAGSSGAEEVPAAEASHPARFWAQIGIGQQRNALRFTYRQYARRAPEAFEGQSGWYAAWNNTNRLLVGPFDSLRAAQAFLTAAAAEGEIDGHTFRSDNGQEVAPLSP
ncbi:MAG: SPOR domain-containing protein, partial [Sphingomonadaceae bacterium]|nr:SPOR domain-containing protein [Sphingomonadaceae bacterium]